MEINETLINILKGDYMLNESVVEDAIEYPQKRNLKGESRFRDFSLMKNKFQFKKPRQLYYSQNYHSQYKSRFIPFFKQGNQKEPFTTKVNSNHRPIDEENPEKSPKILFSSPLSKQY